MRDIRICLCQTLCIDGDREGNFRRIENALSEARGMLADIACLPETCILGWANPDAHQLAHPIPGPDTDRLSELACRYDVTISAGLCEKHGENLHDSAALIDRDGSLLLKHRKINLLTELMSPPYTPGEDIRAVDTRFGRVGMLICADTFIDEYLERMRLEKPDLVLVPYGWAAENEKWPEHGKALAATVSKAARAIGAPVIGVDLVGAITHGPWRGRTYGGQSVACGASGDILAVLRDRDTDVVAVELRMPG